MRPSEAIKASKKYPMNSGSLKVFEFEDEDRAGASAAVCRRRQRTTSTLLGIQGDLPAWEAVPGPMLCSFVVCTPSHRSVRLRRVNLGRCRVVSSRQGVFSFSAFAKGFGVMFKFEVDHHAHRHPIGTSPYANMLNSHIIHSEYFLPASQICPSMGNSRYSGPVKDGHRRPSEFHKLVFRLVWHCPPCLSDSLALSGRSCALLDELRLGFNHTSGSCYQAQPAGRCLQGGYVPSGHGRLKLMSTNRGPPEV